MAAIGAALFMFGIIASFGIKVDEHDIDWRDWVTGFPILLGLLLMTASVVVWLWGVMP